METVFHRHYITVNESGCIIDAFSDGPHPEKDIMHGEQPRYRNSDIGAFVVPQYRDRFRVQKRVQFFDF